VRLEPAKPESAGVVGEYYWAGAAGTTFWICPKHDMVVVALTQLMPYTSKLGDAVKRAAYESIIQTSATKKTDAGK
jgi:CubicO group peptidase (beta-lactamase class C family)